MSKFVDNGPMLNAYPDSCGGRLSDIVSVLSKDEFKDVFQSFYILPSIFNTDLDRGFSVIDYNINEEMADKEDIDKLQELGIDLKLDFILNHASVLSPQFQDLLKNGENSKYQDFFINWNKFWEGYGEMTPEGYIQPDQKYIKDMFFRKPGLPILMVRMPDGSDVPYWNTFYQEVQYPRFDAQDLMENMDIQYLAAQRLSDIVRAGLDEGKKPSEIEFGRFEKYKDQVVELLESRRRYLGQMDLNIKSDLVWEHYRNTLKTLSGYGAKIVRLDAFAYAPKEPGKKNFLNEPDTWDVLEKVKKLADEFGVSLLPEIHASYSEKIYETVAGKGYMTYDFFLPGLLIYAIENKNGEVLKKWAQEIQEKKIRVVNMLGCHDGIPLLDLKGILKEEEIQSMIDTIVGRGGFVKDLHGAKNMYYQVNATYYSALGDDDKKMLFARAIQMFMPGKPQVWYLDLFAGKNDHEAVKRAGAGGHKEINRTNLSMEQIEEALKKDVVKKQLELLRFRNTNPAFGFDSGLNITTEGSIMTFTWKKDGHEATLRADFSDYSYEIK
ncbi:MAG: glycosidase [Butyrivibrio sp.]|uniref:alpha-amylase family glycosyl hydrolase n=1 Tax=Butyrivibrio sp. TaxID=28121 RepID=UPI001B2841AD|nr:alpha-amylase family glycosyl hydrolase [Butyrivibrio sp.]MBO5622483.1 glycosidase [Butyrivibrio sp.]MBP3278910.1 glycosidase [Butyrivibrio sp.]MBP3783689.1 glycosidase [Butyrivibrio sp.]MBP3814730.1 glycosidase [Butyrivibrio sp.]